MNQRRVSALSAVVVKFSFIDITHCEKSAELMSINKRLAGFNERK